MSVIASLKGSRSFELLKGSAAVDVLLRFKFRKQRFYFDDPDMDLDTHLHSLKIKDSLTEFAKCCKSNILKCFKTFSCQCKLALKMVK